MDKEIYDLLKVQLEIDEDTMELGYLITYDVGVATVINLTGIREHVDTVLRELSDEILIKMQEQAENARAEEGEKE